VLHLQKSSSYDRVDYSRISIFFKLCELLSHDERDNLQTQLAGSSVDFHQKLLERRDYIFDPRTHDHQIFCSAFEEILPGPIILKKLNYQSAKVGILTARGSRGTNQLLIQEVLKALDAYMPLEFQYFVGDSENNHRIAALPGTANKKAEVLCNLLDGVRTHYLPLSQWDGGHDDVEAPEHGALLVEIEPRYKHNLELIQFEKIIFYEDEIKNIEVARKRSANYGSPGKELVVLDVNHFSTPLAVSQLLQELSQEPKQQNKEVLHMFDIDGTLLNPDAEILLGEPHLGKHSVNQEEFASIPHEQLPKLKPDYSYFSDPHKIIRSIQEAKQKGILFRKKSKVMPIKIE
jgi:hypothetical protein